MMREDWIEISVGDICNLKNGFAFKSKDYVDISKTMNFRMSQIRPGGRIDLDHNPKYLPDNYAEIYSEYLLKAGDLVIAMTDMASDTKILGVPTLIKKDYRILLLNQRVGKLYDLKLDCIYLPFLRYIITSPHIYSYYKTLGKGGVQINLGKSDILNAKFPLPPLPEQRAIVAKIEQLFSELDNGVANLKAAKAKLAIYRQAVLKKAFEGELTKEWREKNPYNQDKFIDKLKQEKQSAIKEKLINKGDYFPKIEKTNLIYKGASNWLQLPWKTLTSNAKYAMKRGPFGSALKKEFFVEKGYTVYEQGHAINDDPYRDRYFINEEKYEELKAFRVKPGDMIISCSGVTLGRICLLPEDCKSGIINQALLKIDLDSNIMIKKFFIIMFRSETFQRKIFQKSLGTAMPNMVGMTELKELIIPVPSIEEQKQIVQEIETRLSVCDNILRNIEEGLEKAEALRQSILKKAFEGRLLSAAEGAACRQQPDWEPAEKLLERIKRDENNAK